MPNIAKVLKDEIQRLARKEVGQAIAPLRKSSVWLKKTIAEQRQRIAALEKENRKLALQQGRIRQMAGVDAGGQETAELRITGRQVKSLRSRLGITQMQLAKLLGVSGNIVTIWERKPGRLQIRRAEIRKAIADLKGMKRSQVQEKIEEKKSAKRARGSGKKRK